MYQHNYTLIVDAGVAVVLEFPEWKDKGGKTVDKADEFGCKAIHKLIHPDYCIVMDEVGGNIHMKGDGHIGGEKYLIQRCNSTTNG